MTKSDRKKAVKAKKGRRLDGVGIFLVVLIIGLIVFAIILGCLIYMGNIQMQASVNAQKTRIPTVDMVPETNNRNIWETPATQREGETPQPQATTDYLYGTVFAGDSNTVRLGAYGLIDPAVCFAKDSIGVSAVTYLQLVESDYYTLTIPEAIQYNQPNRVVMTFGTNDVGGLYTYQFIEQYRSAVDAIRRADDCEIFVNSIFPAREWNSYTKLTKERIEYFNEALRAMCEEDGIPFINSYEVLVDEDGWCKPEYTIDDGVHLNDAGLQVFLDYFQSHAYEAEQLVQNSSSDQSAGTNSGLADEEEW